MDISSATEESDVYLNHNHNTTNLDVNTECDTEMEYAREDNIIYSAKRRTRRVCQDYE